MPNTEYSIYLNANIGIIGDIEELLCEFVSGGAAIGLFCHRDRTTVDEEVEACVDMGEYDPVDLPKARGQLQMIKDSGMPALQRLTDNAVTFRWHKHTVIECAVSDWWEQINRYTKRGRVIRRK